MKGDAKVIEYLNKALYNELIAINQYFLHAKMLKNWGLKELAEHEYHESIDEMKHADKLSERILFLDGLPNFQAWASCASAKARAKCSPATWRWSWKRCRCCAKASPIARASRTSSAASLLDDILESEEEHIDWIETQLSLIDRVGEQNYLAMKMEG